MKNRLRRSLKGFDRPVRFLPALIALSVLLRAAGAVYMGSEVVALPGTADQVSYHALALRVLGGNGFSFDTNWWPMTAAGAPTAHWSFLYTLYLAAVYAVVQAPLAARLIQALVVGVLHVLLVFLLGREIFNEKAGLFAAAATALYTYFIYYAGTLMTEPYYITAILAVLLVTLRLREAVSPHEVRRRAVQLGLLLGVTVLLRQLFLLVIPLLLLWLAIARRRFAGAGLFTIAAASIGIVVVMILPFTIYNYARFDRIVLLNTNAGYAFYLANHPVYGTDFIPARQMEDYQSLVPAEARGLDEAALDQYLLKAGLGFVLEDPGRYLLLSLDRIPEYFRFWPSADSSMISNLSRVTSFGLALPFMLAGLWLWWRDRPREGLLDLLGRPAALLLAFGLYYSAMHIFTWALVRYRLPVDAVMLLFAGLALQTVFERLTRPSARPVGASG